MKYLEAPVNIVRGFCMALLVFSSASYADGIINQPGSRLNLCGATNLAKTNALLRNDFSNTLGMTGSQVDRQFEAGYPAGFPANYWGINTSNQAYVCLGVTSYSQSEWTFGSYSYQGAYSQFSLTVLGFRVDSSGNREDVNGDGVVNDYDLVQMHWFSTFAAGNVTQSQDLYSAFTGAWNTQATTGTTQLSGGVYPNSVQATKGDSALFSASYVQSRLDSCLSGSVSAGRCKQWGSFSGSSYEIASEAATAPISIEFKHSGNRWLSYAAGDSYTLGDSGLANLFQQIEFQPKFWVIAAASSFNYYLK